MMFALLSKIRRIASVFAICFLSLAVYAAESDAPVYDQSKTTLMVTRAQPEFVIKLQSNPTTGYVWQLRDYDKSLVLPVRHRYVAPDTKLMGAPGFDLWTFKVKPEAFTAPHRTTVRLVYVRPWEEKQVVSEVEFVVTTGGESS